MQFFLLLGEHKSHFCIIFAAKLKFLYKTEGQKFAYVKNFLYLCTRFKPVTGSKVFVSSPIGYGPISDSSRGYPRQYTYPFPTFIGLQRYQLTF